MCYRENYLTDFHQPRISDALWARDECFTLWLHGHSGVDHLEVWIRGLVNELSPFQLTTCNLILCRVSAAPGNFLEFY